jgi:hypothetical protein
MTSLTTRLPELAQKLSLRKALMDLFWIATLLPLPIVGVVKVASALARL